MPFFLLCCLFTKSDSLWGPKMVTNSSQGCFSVHTQQERQHLVPALPSASRRLGATLITTALVTCVLVAMGKTAVATSAFGGLLLDL